MRKITFITRLILSFVLTGILVVLALAIGYTAAIGIFTLICYGLSFVVGSFIASVMLFIFSYASAIALLCGMWWSVMNFKKINAWIVNKFAWAKLYMANAWDDVKYYVTNPKELWSVTKTAAVAIKDGFVYGAVSTWSFIKSIPARIKSWFTKSQPLSITEAVIITA